MPSHLRTAMRLEYSVEKPLNREPSIKALEGAYDRNHGPIPYLDDTKHLVKVDGCVRYPLELSIQDLRDRFSQHEITCTLQCAGNRRHTMRTRIKEVDGIDWGDGAVMNCRWKGVKLRDILQEASPTLNEHDGHVAFSCYETPVQGSDWYGASIELERAMSDEADVLVVLEMNGEKLTPEHGFPVRTLVPGVSGCRSVKWLNRITVQSEESDNLYQRRDYKKLPPEATDRKKAEQFWDTTPALQDMPINSVIAIPQTDDTIQLPPTGTVLVKGYALPQGSHGPIVRVEVSADGGKTWQEAEILGAGGRASKWSWSLWQAEVKLKPGSKRVLLSRATDKGGNQQSPNPVWNLRGVGYNGYGEARNLTVV